jgi:hypothetical protein
MKTALLIITLIFGLTSCKNVEDTKKVVAIGQVGLDLLVKHKVISTEDASVVKETGELVVTVQEITASGK